MCAEGGKEPKGRECVWREGFLHLLGDQGPGLARAERCFSCWLHSQLCSKLTFRSSPKSSNDCPVANVDGGWDTSICTFILARNLVPDLKLMSVHDDDSPNRRNLSRKLSPAPPSLMAKWTIGRAYSPRSSFHGAEVIDAAASGPRPPPSPSPSLCVTVPPPPFRRWNRRTDGRTDGQQGKNLGTVLRVTL